MRIEYICEECGEHYDEESTAKRCEKDHIKSKKVMMRTCEGCEQFKKNEFRGINKKGIPLYGIIYDCYLNGIDISEHYDKTNSCEHWEEAEYDDDPY